jgi:hypothetical protein
MTMTRMMLLIAMLMLVAGTGFAHGKGPHVMGTVTAITDNSISVQTADKNLVTVYTMPDTKYEKSGSAVSLKDLRIGDRVVIHAQKMNDKLMATEVRFGAVNGVSPQH